MASNQLGQILRITTWGESHGQAIGVVIDGCPAGLAIDAADINAELARRAPGSNPYVSPRQEPDIAQIYSGLYEGKTTGAPVSIIIPNQDADSAKYEPIKHLFRPGHANYTYLEKYGIFDYRGGGRASARETACRVAAGAVAKKLLQHFEVNLIAFIKQIGGIEISSPAIDLKQLKDLVQKDPIFCPCSNSSQKMRDIIAQAKEEGDSLGAVIEFIVEGLPAGLGDPVYEKLEANLAKAMLSLPATKGFELGAGFQAAAMKGSEHNDAFVYARNQVQTSTNHAGGTLGGISTGMPIVGRVAFKPTSSILKKQTTLDVEGNPAELKLPEGSRHDPCVGIRAVPVVEAMLALVCADALLLNRCAKL